MNGTTQGNRPEGDRPKRSRAATVREWSSYAFLITPLLPLALYWRAFQAWFQKDDFAWLSLRSQVHGAHELGWALFAPLAQGTIRTLSERLVFLAFGIHPLFYRLLAFVTCAATIVLLNAVVTRLTGSRAAGFWAAIIWTLNSAIAVPLAWASIYNELMWPFTMLLAFWCLIRYVETGERRFFIAQCVVFLLGFFVLETNVVYPAIAAVFAITWPAARRQKLLIKVLPLFAISALYTAIHFYLAPLPSSGPYQLHWDLKMFQTLTIYWGWALGPGQGRLLDIRSTLVRSSLVWTLTFGLLALLRRDRRALLFAAWFLITLAPLLPLRDHLTAEYLTTPVLGLAMWGGWAIVSAWRANAIGKIAAAVLLLIYAGISIPVGQARLAGVTRTSQQIQPFVENVVAAARVHPGNIVLLEGVNAEQFNSAVYDYAFRLFGIQDLYLVPENRAAIAPDRYFTRINEFFATPAMAQKALHKGLAVVFDVSSGTARDATAEYARQLKAGEVSSRVELGSELFADQLGDGWYTNDGGFRWMGKRASVTLAGPRSANERLYVTGFAPTTALKSGPVTATISIDGATLLPVRITKADAAFTFDFALPARLIGAPKVEVAIELDRTFKLPPDERIFGMVFTSLEIR